MTWLSLKEPFLIYNYLLMYIVCVTSTIQMKKYKKM